MSLCFASRWTLLYSSGSLGSGWACLMIEFEIVYFLFNQGLAFYLANYTQETIIFILVLSALHFVARLSKARRGAV